MSVDINRQMGEVTVSIEYMKEKLDALNDKIDKQQHDIDSIKIQVAEIRGAKKFAEWLRSILAGVIGAIISALTLYFTWRGGQ